MTFTLDSSWKDGFRDMAFTSGKMELHTRDNLWVGSEKDTANGDRTTGTNLKETMLET